MRIFLRILAGLAIGLALLIGIVAIVLATLDMRTLIAPLTAELEKATGRKVTIGGDARIGLSLSPTLELNDVALANAPWGSGKDMVRAKRLEAQVALMPLLSRRVDIVRFTLVEPAILLETDAQGRGNWAFGAPRTAATRSDPVSDAAGAFSLGELAIDKGTITWRDGRTGEVTAVRVDRLYLRARDPSKPVVAEFKGAVGDVPVAIEGHFGPLAALQARQWPWPLSLKGEAGGRRIEAQAKLRETPEGIEAGDFEYATGATRIRGKVLYAARSQRPYVRFDLAGGEVRAADLAPFGAAAHAASTQPPGPAPAPARTAGRLFPATPLSLSALRSVDADGTIAFDKLVLADGRTLGNLVAKLKLADGRLDVAEWRTAVFGGTANGQLIVDARSERSAQVVLNLDGRGLDLAALLAAAGVARTMQAGRTDIDIDVNARGASPRDLAASLSGVVQAKVTHARFASSASGLPQALGQVVMSLNPLAGKSAPTELTCAVVRLPFAGGVARVDRSIAIETAEVGISASGTIDLRNETLDLAMRPRAKIVNAADLAKLAGAVRLQGPLDAPQVVVDPAASIAAAIDIAQMARSGRAALQGLITPAAPSGPGECDVALGARAAAAQPAPPNTSAGRAGQAPARQGDAAQEINRALGRLFGR